MPRTWADRTFQSLRFDLRWVGYTSIPAPEALMYLEKNIWQI